MAIQTFKRYETKFVIDKDKMSVVLPRLLEYMEFDKYCIGEKDYPIYSLYFDTKNNDVVRHSVQKPYYKEKLRLRSYKLNPEPEDTVFLEIKKKIGGIVNKRRVVLTYRQAVEFIKNGKVPQLEGVQKQIMQEIVYYTKIHPIEKATLIHYDRIALFGKDDKALRITFDRHLTSDITSDILRTDSDGKLIVGEDTRVMEVKISGAAPLWLVKILSEHKIYKGSFSKIGNTYKKSLKPSVVSFHPVCSAQTADAAYVG
ncbi:MAG: polyphosphate polymerase domain-containing protein [Clostridia bacterium]|nr:polyphosphate polymerase domain-containing protein [Clostridia bacterium]MBR2176696.1 polyphosphate polymerase domain-containing protein [Clostridia bacterium]